MGIIFSNLEFVNFAYYNGLRITLSEKKNE